MTDTPQTTDGRRKVPETHKAVLVVLDRELIKQIDHYAADHDLYRTHAIAELVRRGLISMTTDAEGGA